MDGIQFAIKFIQNNPNLKDFHWGYNPSDILEDVNDLIVTIVEHPLLDSINLSHCLEPGINGYDVLRSLFTSNKHLSHIILGDCNICTAETSRISDHLAANSPLRQVNLSLNDLDDDNAISIAKVLKQNTNLTNVGNDVPCNVVFDSACLNSMADSNHTCKVYSLDVFGDSAEAKQGLGENLFGSETSYRAHKLYILLRSKCIKGTIVNDLDLEFGEDALKFAPKVLSCIHNYSGCDGSRGGVVMEQPLDIFYKILRRWKMPELYENHA